MIHKLCFDSVSEGSRILYRKNYSSTVREDQLIEKSPSGEFFKFKNMGWLSSGELSHLVLLEVLGSAASEEGDSMCPNCVTPWKYNRPHMPYKCRGAPGGSPELERYLDALELPRHSTE